MTQFVAMPKNKSNATANYREATGPLSIRMTNDYIFKVLMQKNPHVLKGLISSLLHLSAKNITDAQILNPIIIGERIDDKTIILDVFVELNYTSHIDLEMQVADQGNWVDRSTYYLCRNYADLECGDGFNETKPIYQISFLDFTLFKDAPEFYSTNMFCNIKSHYIYSNKLSIRIVDLSKINLATSEDRKYNIDKWARLFKAQTWEEIKMLSTQNTAFREAADTIYQMSEDKQIRRQYEAREDYLRCQRDVELNMQKLKEELAQKDKALAEKDRQIAEMKAQIAAQNG